MAASSKLQSRPYRAKLNYAHGWAYANTNAPFCVRHLHQPAAYRTLPPVQLEDICLCHVICHMFRYTDNTNQQWYCRVLLDYTDVYFQCCERFSKKSRCHVSMLYQWLWPKMQSHCSIAAPASATSMHRVGLQLPARCRPKAYCVCRGSICL